MNRIGPSSVSTTVSIASRVVPGMSCTTARSSPISRLNSVDLPTFGRPTIATPGIGGPSSLDLLGAARPRGSSSTSSSSRSPVPRPCSAVTGNGSPRPSDTNSQMSPRRDSLSTLFATSSTGRFARRSHSATFASSSVTPTVASTTRSTASASRTARSICALTFSSSVGPAREPTTRVDDAELGRPATRRRTPCGRG